MLSQRPVWIDYFRGSQPAVAELDRLLAEEPPFLCGPILAELVAGLAPGQRQEVWLALSSLPFVELGRDAWTKAGELANELRRDGASVPLLELLIAVASVRADAALWTRDTDFQRIAGVLPDLLLLRVAA